MREKCGRKECRRRLLRCYKELLARAHLPVVSPKDRGESLAREKRTGKERKAEENRVPREGEVNGALRDEITSVP